MKTIDSLLENNYKSEGERKIAQFLDSYNIDYNYEPGILVRNNGYDRIWYPDFGLPKYSLFIEYFGMENNPSYDHRTKNKLDIYKQNNIEVIPVFPDTLKEDYGRYILDEIYKRTADRVYDIEKKICNYYKNNSSRMYSMSKKSYSMIR